MRMGYTSQHSRDHTDSEYVSCLPSLSLTDKHTDTQLCILAQIYVSYWYWLGFQRWTQVRPRRKVLMTPLDRRGTARLLQYEGAGLLTTGASDRVACMSVRRIQMLSVTSASAERYHAPFISNPSTCRGRRVMPDVMRIN